jgi:hypothetical protein
MAQYTEGADLDCATIPENDRYVNDARVGGSSKPKGTLFECHHRGCSYFIYTEKKSAKCPRHGPMQKTEPEEE